MIHLDTVFANAKGYASKRNAENKLNEVADAIPDNATVFTYQRPDGRWLAIVLHRYDLTMNIPYLISKGICITN